VSFFPLATRDGSLPMTPKAGDTVPPMIESASTGVMRQDQEVVELHLLLPRYQADELEAVAHRRGMTTGQMLRRVIGEMLASQPVTTGS
jgi:hypothetical protein